MKKVGNEYFLMHKNVPVCLMEVSDDGRLGSFRKNSAEIDHFPLGGQMNDIKFHEWWRDRAVPKTRNGAKSALAKLGYESTNSALVDNLALSLSDCYWIKPRGEDLSWEDVNLFSNEFVDTFGELTINKDHEIDLRRKTKFNCAASQGELQKKWCIDSSGKRYMVKGNYGSSFQQSITELFATKLHESQGFSNYTEYMLTKVDVEGGLEGIGCMSYDFCNDNIECISAWELLQTIKIKQNESLFHPLKKVCLNLGISDEEFTAFMDYEIMTDYLMSNTDRHMNNISIIRNPDSLEVLGFAPIYDSGNSMFYNIPYEQLEKVKFADIKTHSFIAKEVRLLSYVQNREAVNLDKAYMSFDIYKNDMYERQIRIPRIKNLYEQKILKLAAFQNGRNLWKEIK